MTLGEYILRYRAVEKITALELSRKLGISNSYISFIENGWTEKCSFRMMAKIVKGINLTPEEVYDIVMSCDNPSERKDA